MGRAAPEIVFGLIRKAGHEAAASVPSIGMFSPFNKHA